MDDVIELIGLADPGRSNRVHDLRHRGRIYGAVRVTTHGSTHAELVRLGCRSEAARLVRTKAILPGQRHREAPTRTGLSTQARRWHAEGDIARNGTGANRDGTQRITMGIDVTLPEPLHLDQPAPRSTWRNRIVALRERSCHRSIGGRGARIMYVHIYQLSTQRAAKSRRQVASLQLEGDGRTIRTHDDAEIQDIKGPCMEVCGRRIGIVARAIVVVSGIRCLKDKRPWSKVEENASLIVCGSTRRADGYCIQHRGSTCDRDRHAERAIRFGWCPGH